MCDDVFARTSHFIKNEKFFWWRVNWNVLLIILPLVRIKNFLQDFTSSEFCTMGKTNGNNGFVEIMRRFRCNLKGFSRIRGSCLVP